MSAAATGCRGAPFAGAAARLHILDECARHRFVVILARPPAEASLAALSRGGRAGGVLTHAAGVTWPDRSGLAMARALLQNGGVVALAFTALADALACHRRVVAEVRP